MEHTGTLPEVGIRLDGLRDLLAQPGPVASVYLDTPSEIDNAAYRDARRWGALRQELAAAGAPAAALDAVEALVADAHRDGDALAAFAGAEGLRFAGHAARPARHQLARWDTLPSLVPLVSWRQEWPAHVVVVADHAGADLYAAGALVEAGGGAGGHRPLHDSAGGGWLQRRFQQRVHDTWKHNADEVAGRLVELAETVEPELILIGGDPRAEGLVRAALPRGLQERLERVDATRAADGSGEATVAEVATMVATAVARDTVAVLEELRQQLGRHDRAVEGPGPTLAALREGQVELLVVHDDVDDERRAWFGQEPAVVAETSRELQGIGAGAEPSEGRLIDVAVRAAVGTGAAVRVVPGHGGPAGGLGALLRWAGGDHR